MLKKILIIFLFSISLFSVSFAEDVTPESIFLESVIQDGGYINYGVEISENKDGTYDLSIMVKENLLGVDIGFFASPNILKNFEATKVKPQTYMAEEYFYIMAEKRYSDFESLSKDLNLISGFEIAKKENELIGKVDLSIWNEERKEDEILNVVYSTNKYLFSYNPLKKIEGNYSDISEENYVWMFENDSVNYLFAQPVNSFGTIIFIIITGLIFFGLVVFVIIRKNRY